MGTIYTKAQHHCNTKTRIMHGRNNAVKLLLWLLSGSVVVIAANDETQAKIDS